MRFCLVCLVIRHISSPFLVGHDRDEIIVTVLVFVAQDFTPGLIPVDSRPKF